MTLRLLNSIDISDGAITRHIALYDGDLTAIPPEHRADILVVSAFPDDYLPTRTSVIGALYRKGLSVGVLATSKAHDLRATSAFWISQPLSESEPVKNIGQIACFEPAVLGSPRNRRRRFVRGLFPFLDDRRNHVVAMPILASGNQRSSPRLCRAQSWTRRRTRLARGLAISELENSHTRGQTRGFVGGSFRGFQVEIVDRSPEAQPVHGIRCVPSFSTANAAAADCAKSALLARADAKRIFDFRLSIDKGKSWQEELDHAISSSRNIVTILSPAYFASNECREELMQARLRNKRAAKPLLFPVYWQDWGKELDLWLQAINYVDCREANAQTLAATMSTLALA